MKNNNWVDWLEMEQIVVLLSILKVNESICALYVQMVWCLMQKRWDHTLSSFPLCLKIVVKNKYILMIDMVGWILSLILKYYISISTEFMKEWKEWTLFKLLNKKNAKGLRIGMRYDNIHQQIFKKLSVSLKKDFETKLDEINFV